jgi:hypothetical protein
LVSSWFVRKAAAQMIRHNTPAMILPGLYCVSIIKRPGWVAMNKKSDRIVSGSFV